MAKSDTFHCSVITPERKVLECDAKFVALPAHDGEVGVLTRRAPLVCKLGIGVLRIQSGDTTHRFMIDEGFAQVRHDQLTILTEHAAKAEDIDPAKAQAALSRALEMPIPDESAFDARSKAVQRARIELRLHRGPRSA